MSLEIIKGIDNFPPVDRGLAVTIGTFDGIHLGHQAILKQLVDTAAVDNMKMVAITFEPHPRVLVTPDSPPPLLTNLTEKAKLFGQYLDGILLVLNFNRELMNMNAEQFARKYLIERLKIKKLIVGYDHAFGKDRSGTINDLMGLSHKYNFDLQIVNPVIVDGRPISSTRIRRVIAEQNLSDAIDLLGHPYLLAGKIKKGISLGKKLGFPTANIDIIPRKLLPKDGVYACSVEHGEKMYGGMMFIGKNHFNPEENKSIEVNIFDFDKEIYNEEIICYPETFIRENRKFDSTDQLVEQLKLDRENVLKIKR